jgi:hypothetical protein
MYCLNHAFKRQSRPVSWYNSLPLFSVFCCSFCPLKCLSGIRIADSRCYMFPYCLSFLCQCRKAKPNTLYYLCFLVYFLVTLLITLIFRIVPSMMDARRTLEETPFFYTLSTVLFTVTCNSPLTSCSRKSSLNERGIIHKYVQYWKVLPHLTGWETIRYFILSNVEAIFRIGVAEQTRYERRLKLTEKEEIGHITWEEMETQGVMFFADILCVRCKKRWLNDI